MSILQKPHKLRRGVLILVGVLGILGASGGSTEGGELIQSPRLKLLRLDVALLPLQAGGGTQQAAPIDIAPGLKKLVENSKTRNPTVETPTEIEGKWLGSCHSVNTSFNGKTARSFNVGFIFIGNSFFRQLDYYPEADCRYSGRGTLAENRVAAEIAAGWFALRDGPGGLGIIDLLAAPNFGSVWIMNVYQIKKSEHGPVLLMGDAEVNNKERPTKATEEYRRWDPCPVFIKCYQ